MNYAADYVPLNYCRVCDIDFTSLAAFDAHLGGTPQDRVHLAPDAAGLERRGTVEGVDRYGVVISESDKARLAALRLKSKPKPKPPLTI